MGELNDNEDVSTGISRRQMIARSAVAGGLVWTAPTLLSSPVGAQTAPCCPTGDITTTIKISSTPSQNCGVSALSARGQYNYPCLADLATCLQTQGYITVSEQTFDNGQIRSAEVILTGGIQAISVGLKSTSDLYFSDCPNYCPNITSTQGKPSQTGVTTQLPIRVYGWGLTSACTADMGVDIGSAEAPRTVILIDAPLDKQGRPDPINHMEMSICIPSVLTGLCP